jgi:hypothetical protein
LKDPRLGGHVALGEKGVYTRREEKGRIEVLYRLKPEIESWCFLKLVLENKRIIVLYRLELDL